MAKVSPVSIKYMIYSKFEATGTLEKPDVIGAIFGQTEGLLGTDLEMRDLQKEGKIGRIEVELKSEGGKTTGTIQIPSALDKTETTLIAAAVETIERIGPSDAKIKIEKIEDVRGSKREYILERAKKLLENIEEKMPKTKEMSQNLKNEARESRLKEYGDEKLPSGDLSGDKIIVVEGRADVINLLRNNINNVIAMNGTILPETIKKLSYDKEITLFVDGDRGGKLIAKNVIDNARVDFVATAPDGKEVEELAGKEILYALRRKIPAGEFSMNSKTRGRRDFDRERNEKKIKEKSSEEETEETAEITDKDKEKLKDLLEKVTGTKSALILDNKLESISKISSRGIFTSLSRMRKKPFAIVIDTATPSVIKAAEEKNIKHIIAKSFSITRDTDVNLISL